MSDRQWKDLRAKHIGGSEIAALFGESSYLTKFKIWHIKKGNINEDDLDNDERIQAGQFFEEGAIKWANKRWGYAFYQPRVYVSHTTVAGMGCTPDGLDAIDPSIMCQVKNVDSLQFALHWTAEGDEIRTAPLEILLQCQHELEVADKRENVLIVVVGGNRLFRMRCQRDRDIGSILRTKVSSFWYDITNDHAPDPEFDRDSITIKELHTKLPTKEFIDLSQDKYMVSLAEKGLAARVRRDKNNDELDAINAEILHLVGNAQNIKCGEILIKFHRNQTIPRYQSTKEIF